jgi:2-C-methyl-D-erythritol 2,4-cyclodiphosphate synthase
VNDVRAGPRVGSGLDVHAFGEGVPLILGGVEIPFHRGLAGHSDGDVLTHAVIDAVLGAAGRGDIGRWFPSADPGWAGADSVGMLRTVVDSLHRDGWQVVNVDATVVAQQPHLADHVGAMRGRLADALRIPVEDVSVKATTTDHLGALGRSEGIAALATVLMVRPARTHPVQYEP